MIHERLGLTGRRGPALMSPRVGRTILPSGSEGGGATGIERSPARSPLADPVRGEAHGVSPW